MLWHRISRIIKWLPAILITFVLISFATIQIPRVQTRILNNFITVIAKNTSFRISVGHANLTWYDEMMLKDVRLYHAESDSTLFHSSKVSIDFSLIHFLLKREIASDKLTINDPRVHIIKPAADLPINISQFVTELKEYYKKDSTSRKSTVKLRNVVINEGIFSYNDISSDSLLQGKDFSHMQLREINALVSEMHIAGDSLMMYVNSLSADDPVSSLDIHDLNGFVKITPNLISLKEFKSKLGNSILSNEVNLWFDDYEDFKDPIDSLEFDAKLTSSRLALSDIRIFKPDFELSNSDFLLSGHYSGTLRHLHLKDININFGHQSVLKGSGEIKLAQNAMQSVIDFEFDQTSINPTDLQGYVSTKIWEKLIRFDRLDISGKYAGQFNDFKLKARLNSSLGTITSDAKFRIDDTGKAHYNGLVEFRNFRASKLFDEFKTVRRISLTGSIEGEGLDVGTAKFDLNASISQLTTDFYRFKNIMTDGHFERKYFSATFDIADPNLDFDGLVELDLRQEEGRINVKANLDSINLRSVGLVNEELRASSKIDMSMKGLRIDEMVGYLNLRDADLMYQHRILHIDSLKFLSTLIQNQRTIHLETDGISGSVQGEFRNHQLLKALKSLYLDVKNQVINDEEQLYAYYQSKKETPPDTINATLVVNVFNANKFVQPLLPSLSLSDNIKIEGKMKHAHEVSFSFFTQIESLTYEGRTFNNNHLDINLSKGYHNRDLLGAVHLTSASQQWTANTTTEGLETELIWYGKEVDFWGQLYHKKYENEAKINGQVTFLNDSTVVQVFPSDLKLLGQPWKWDKKNVISVKDRVISFSNFKLINQQQSAELKGIYHVHEGGNLSITLGEIDLSIVNKVLPMGLEGILDGQLKFTHINQQNHLTGNVIARGIEARDLLIGSLFSDVDWDMNRGLINLTSSIVKNQNNVLSLKGRYDLQSISDPLNFEASIEAFDLKLLRPIFSRQFSNLSGTSDGQFKLTGNLDNPNIKGHADLKNGHLKIDYLNTSYGFDGRLEFDGKYIRPNAFMLTDAHHNKAELIGYLEHNGPSEIGFYIDGHFNNFNVLNTASTDSKLYYGTAYGTGLVQFRGDLRNFSINAQAKTTKGTRLSLPISSQTSGSAVQKSYIQFIDLQQPTTDTTSVTITQNNPVEDDFDLSLNLDLELTSDAYMEMIFDIKSGDIIRGRGNGNLKLQMNSDGDFEMFGDYVIEQGGYNFTLYNIINKEFTIQKGSSVTWLGDPYGAQLKIKANYAQLASLSPLLTDLSEQDQSSIEIRKKYPTLVSLNLTGDLLTPSITFDINVNDYPKAVTVGSNTYDLEGYINAFRTRIKSNEQEMNRQVFSLIVLRKLSPEEGFQINSETIGSSFSEFVSNQLSYWASQVDENLEIDVDLASLDQDAFNTFQLRLSYTFLDGRLRVTRGGGLPGDQNRDDLYNMIGDWTVEYLITEDGRFRAKVYSRPDLNVLDLQTGENGLETGFSLQFVRSFDQLRQILQDTRAKNITPTPASLPNN